MRTIYLTILLPTFSILAPTQHQWPEIRPVHTAHSVVVPQDADADVPFSVDITGTDGRALYRIECHRSFTSRTNIHYSGDYQCGLFAHGPNGWAAWTLFAANTRNESSADWWNRGRMRAIQLKSDGPCNGFPEFGAVRHFRLRGMLITLTYSKLHWSSTQESGSDLRQFTINIDAQNDRNAKAPTPAPGAGSPPRACYP